MNEGSTANWLVGAHNEAQRLLTLEKNVKAGLIAGEYKIKKKKTVRRWGGLVWEVKVGGNSSPHWHEAKWQESLLWNAASLKH